MLFSVSDRGELALINTFVETTGWMVNAVIHMLVCINMLLKDTTRWTPHRAGATQRRPLWRSRTVLWTATLHRLYIIRREEMMTESVPATQWDPVTQNLPPKWAKYYHTSILGGKQTTEQKKKLSDDQKLNHRRLLHLQPPLNKTTS